MAQSFQVGDQTVTLVEAGALGILVDDKVAQHASDKRLHDLYGALADRPAPDPNQAGRRYWAYDAGGVYRDTGGAWEEVPTRPSPHRGTHNLGGGDPLVNLELSQFAASAKNPTDQTIPALRSLGTASFEAAPGNDPRLRALYKDATLFPDRRKTRYQGPGVSLFDDPANEQTVVEITGAAAGPASRTSAGVAEYADNTEAQDPARQDRAIDPAGLQAEITRRLDARMGWLNGAGPLLLENASVTNTVTADLRGVGGIPLDAKGVVLTVSVPSQSAGRVLKADSANALAAAATSPGIFAGANGAGAGQIWAPLGTGGVAGKLRFSSTSGTVTGADVSVNGWWR